MKRVSNLNTLKIGIFGTWYSLWYDKEYYSFLVHKDYRLIEYLTSIYYRLRLPTSHFYLNRISTKYYYIQTNIHLTSPSFNRITKSTKNNRKIFRYISTLEYLFDFTLLLPNYLISNKNNINSILSNISPYLRIQLNNNNYYIYYIYYINFFKLNYFNNFFGSNLTFNFFLYSNKKKLLLNLLSSKLSSTFFINTLKLENKQNYKSRNKNNLFYIFNNFFNIDKNTIITKKNNIKYYLINFLSYFSNNNYFSFYVNIKVKAIITKIINYYFIFIKKMLFLYYFIYLKINIKNNYLYLYLHKIINKYYFFLKKNNYINNVYLYKEKNIVLNNLTHNSYSLNNLYKKSEHNYNLNFISNKKTNYSNKYKEYLNYKFNKFFISSLNNKYGFISYFYIRDFNSLVRENINNTIKIKNEIINMVYFKKINKYNNFNKKIIYSFKKSFFSSFHIYLESSIALYTGLLTFYLPSYYIKKFPFFDTKLIIDYICYNLKRKHKITKILKKISYIYKNKNSSSNKIFIPFFNDLKNNNKNLINKYEVFSNYNNIFNIVFFNKIFYKGIIDKYNPISGLRIEISGPPKKAKMSKTVAYSNIVHNYKLVGKMPTHSVYADIHYHQSHIKLKRSTFGIKVWLFYNTKITNSNNVNKTIL